MLRARVIDASVAPVPTTPAMGPGAVMVPAPTATEPTAALLCGDGIVSTGEGCDDGNVEGGDGCNERCQVEPGYRCIEGLGVCIGCGNGRIESRVDTSIPTSIEACDDGNRQGGDGCSADCELEPGWVCPSPGHPCESSCASSEIGGCGEPDPPVEDCQARCAEQADAGCSARCARDAAAPPSSGKTDAGIPHTVAPDGGAATQEAGTGSPAGEGGPPPADAGDFSTP